MSLTFMVVISKVANLNAGDGHRLSSIKDGRAEGDLSKTRLPASFDITSQLSRYSSDFQLLA